MQKAALAATLLAVATNAGAASADRTILRAVRSFDWDRNYSIDAQELASINEAFASAPVGPLASLDSNKDGTIDRTEVSVVNLSSSSPASALQFDKDGNGVIEGTEVQALRKEFATAPNRFPKSLDRDHNGTLDDDEIAAFNGRLAKAHARKAGLAADRVRKTAPSPSVATTAVAVPSRTVASDTATITWKPPKKNEDGTPIADLAGYIIRYGRAPGSLDQRIVVKGAHETSYVFKGLSSGTWYFTVSSVTSAGAESRPSGVFTKQIVANR